MKTITNKDILISLHLQQLIDFLFKKGALHHFEWEETRKIDPKTGRIGVTANFKTTFSPTHSIDLSASFILDPKKDDLDFAGLNLRHVDLDLSVNLEYLSTPGVPTHFSGNENRIEKFLNALGF